MCWSTRRERECSCSPEGPGSCCPTTSRSLGVAAATASAWMSTASWHSTTEAAATGVGSHGLAALRCTTSVFPGTLLGLTVAGATWLCGAECSTDAGTNCTLTSHTCEGRVFSFQRPLPQTACLKKPTVTSATGRLNLVGSRTVAQGRELKRKGGAGRWRACR